jgi:16S rRNA (guanine527-N7)-methyltransferase
LADVGVRHGLLGPRETPRLWERHLLNCAVVEAAFPDQARVVDVGSGAGLPGLALACARPDLHVDLVDSLARRTRFLLEVVERLGLGDRVRVISGRAEDSTVRELVGRSSWVTARAVAPLERLAEWCLPLLVSRGTLVALKGASAANELDRARPALARKWSQPMRIVDYGTGLVDPPTRTVHLIRK